MIDDQYILKEKVPATWMEQAKVEVAPVVGRKMRQKHDKHHRDTVSALPVLDHAEIGGLRKEKGYEEKIESANNGLHQQKAGVNNFPSDDGQR